MIKCIYFAACPDEHSVFCSRLLVFRDNAEPADAFM